MAPDRPAVSLIVPFAGSDRQLGALLASLSAVTLSDRDETIVADNRPRARPRQEGRIQVLAASGLATPAFARNQGANAARGEWLVFIDADTAPRPSLLDDYFERRPSERTAVLAGAIIDSAAPGSGIAGRRAVARAQMSQSTTMRRRRPYAQTANCAVLRSAFEQVGGFTQAARAGEDADLCFRLQDAGWMLEERPEAAVEHRSRETVPALASQLMRHGSGAAWVNRRFPGTFPAPGTVALVRRLMHDLRAAAAEAKSGDAEQARLALLDLLAAVAYEFGRLLPNERRLRPKRRG